MNRYICDRCGEDINEKRFILSVLMYKDDFYAGQDTYDLCKECFDKLFRWAKEKRREGE